LTGWLMAQGLPTVWATVLGVGLVVTGITYMSLIFGELVPKQLALKNPERIACFMAPAMVWLSRVAYPVVWVLDHSGKAVLKLIGGNADSDRRVTEEEIRTIVAEAESAGVIEPGERQMIASVMRLGDRPVSSVMTPRMELVTVDLSDPVDQTIAAMKASSHSSFPAHEGNPDEVIGVIWVKDLMANGGNSGVDSPLDLRALVRAAPVIPETVDVLDAVETLKKSAVHMGLVHDEYGHFLGVVTPYDILGAITGGFAGSDGEAEAALTTRDDGSLLISGWMPVDDLADATGLAVPQVRPYQTAAGLLIDAFGKIPVAGESIAVQHWRFEVVDMDGRRIDKIIATRQTPATLRAGDMR
ncbi:MAG: hemolysin family protein, partial [Beijerinckiaceae bacterium]